jgi:hypothetical protein
VVEVAELNDLLDRLARRFEDADQAYDAENDARGWGNSSTRRSGTARLVPMGHQPVLLYSPWLAVVRAFSPDKQLLSFAAGGSAVKMTSTSTNVLFTWLSGVLR